MSDFLEKLVEALEPNPTSLRNFKRMYSEPTLKKADPKAPPGDCSPLRQSAGSSADPAHVLFMRMYSIPAGTLYS